jgi:hypothetical protein
MRWGRNISPIAITSLTGFALCLVALLAFSSVSCAQTPGKGAAPAKDPNAPVDWKPDAPLDWSQFKGGKPAKKEDEKPGEAIQAQTSATISINPHPMQGRKIYARGSRAISSGEFYDRSGSPIARASRARTGSFQSDAKASRCVDTKA